MPVRSIHSAFSKEGAVMVRERRVGFELRLVDWLMCRSYSEVAGALVGELSGVALLLTIGRTFSHLTTTPSRISIGDFAIRAAVLAVITSPFAIGAWWTVRTWNRLWRCGRSPWEKTVYDFGVRIFGFWTAILIILLLSRLGATADSGTLFGPMMFLGALAGVFFGVPLALNMGYFWGSAFAAIVNAEHDSHLEIGEPPHLAGR